MVIWIKSLYLQNRVSRYARHFKWSVGSTIFTAGNFITGKHVFTTSNTEIIISEVPINQDSPDVSLQNPHTEKSEYIEEIKILPPQSTKQQFFVAVAERQLEVIQNCLENQIDIIDTQEDKTQRTALHLACVSQQKDTITYLLYQGAHFDIEDA